MRCGILGWRFLNLVLSYGFLLYSIHFSHMVSLFGALHILPSLILYINFRKRFCAICFEDKYAHTTPLFYKPKTLKLYDIHSLKLPFFVYDCTKNQPITYFNNFFTPVHLVHQHLTRCHGNALGSCRLKPISNDALYNYTKSQKVSSVNYEPF